MREKTEQPPQSLISVAVGMLGHSIIHERVVFVTDDPAGIRNLGNVPGACAPVCAAVMPDLIVEHDQAARFAKVGLRHHFPFHFGARSLAS